MTKTISATEAKQTFGALIGKVQREGDSIIIENRGEPAAVIISFDEFENLLELKEKHRREEAMAGLRELRAKINARNEDLTGEQADQIADDLVRNAVESMIAEGTIEYES